ncbi:MAG: hypothetical protein H6567_00025 [Lewinellaceae bacterium]|nr:hypothetical protein [Lewinellaceae bacterium]
MRQIFTLVFLGCLLSGVMAQDKNLTFKFNHYAGSQAMELNKTIFTIHNGKKVMLTRAEFFLSGVTLHTLNHDSFKINDSYILVNANDPTKLHTVGTYPQDHDFRIVKMDVGIDKDKNHADPSLYPASHPLGPKSPDMHWGWAAGYRFIALEGLVDNNNDGTPEQEFQFHSLGDALLFQTILDLTGSHHVETDPMIINLDYIKLFDALSMSGNLIQHGSGTLNKNVLLNAATKKFLNPQIISSTTNVPLDQIANVLQNNRKIMIAFKNKGSEKSIRVYNTSGILVQNYITRDDEFTFELTNIPSGNLFVSISETQNTTTQQIFIY